MATTRRGFVGLLSAIAAGATLDPERLLWIPGKKLFSFPAPVISDQDEINRILAGWMDRDPWQYEAEIRLGPGAYPPVTTCATRYNTAKALYRSLKAKK